MGEIKVLKGDVMKDIEFLEHAKRIFNDAEKINETKYTTGLAISRTWEDKDGEFVAVKIMVGTKKQIKEAFDSG